MVAKRVPASKGMLRRQTLRSNLPVVDPIAQAALRYLARRDRTEAQMRAYLVRLGASSTHVRRVIEQLLAQGYLNDERYALQWASDRLARRPMGRARLEAELIGQGLDHATTALALEHVYGGRSERELALALLRQRPEARNPANRLREASLLRRYGFSEELIEAIVGGGAS